MSFTVIIPARYASSRLPGKPLADIAGKPMIVHVMQKAQASGASRVIVATDHQDVFNAVVTAGGEAIMTSTNHNSGTERLAEVIDIARLTDDHVIVNVQGDEPLIPPDIIAQVANNLIAADCGMATLAAPIHNVEDVFNPNIVKVIVDQHGYAIYFSRAAIPWDRDRFTINKSEIGDFYLRHLGIYAYRAGFIRHYTSWTPVPLEKIEMLEQLRVLWYGEKIHVDQALEIPAVGVDTAEDLEHVRHIIRNTN